MRLFYLQNAAGERIALQGSDTFFYRPQGLGYDIEAGFGRQGDGGYFRVLYDRAKQTSMTGELLFRGDCYAQYKTLVDWINATDTLKMIYSPAGTEYVRNVIFTHIGKSEIEKSGVLSCPATIDPLSPWYRAVPTNFIPAELDGEQLLYYELDDDGDYSYLYDYYYAPAQNENSIGFTAQGHTPAALEVRIPGPVASPAIRLYATADSSVDIGRCAPAGLTVAQGETLVFSTRPDNARVELLDAAGVVTDLLDTLDLADNNFFEVPLRVPVAVEISADTALTQSISINLYQYYRSV